MANNVSPGSESTTGLCGSTAVVTGASSGIGRAIALQLAEAGADVVVHARESLDQARAVVQQIQSLGRRSEVIQADFADPTSYPLFVEQAWSWGNGVDIWINNAGADVLTGTAADWSFDQKLDYLWRVDVLGTIGLSRLVGQRMAQLPDETRDRSILNIGWDQADTGMGGDSGEMFAAVKGAIMAFTRSLAQSLAPRVRANCLAPGWICTAWGAEANEYSQQRACQESLMKRWGTPEDVASVASFLVSPAARFMTGQTVAVNGGRASGEC